MKNLFAAILASAIFSFAHAQSFEGALRIEYKDEAGKVNNADVIVKGDKYCIKRAAGGSDKYSSYILDAKAHSLTCINDRNPKSAVIFNTDKVLAIYEKNGFKPGYKIHESQPYKPTGTTKKIGDNTAAQKRANADTIAYDVWSADIKVDFKSLIPVLRLAGFWNKLEDGQNAILEGKITNRKTAKSSSVSITPNKIKADDKLFTLSRDYQVVDINKFLAEQAQSSKLAELVRGLVGL
jgi:hypothetical protein